MADKIDLTREYFNQLDGIPQFSLWKTAVCYINELSDSDGDVTMRLLFAYRGQTEEQVWKTVKEHAETIGYDLLAITKFNQAVATFTNN